MTNPKAVNLNQNHDDRRAEMPGNRFEIRVKGHLDESWSDWLEGLEVELLGNDEMLLTGPIRDQAALMGVLNRLYGLNLALLSVTEVSREK